MTALPAGFGPEYLSPGTILGNRYLVVREVGRGGYSVVYEGRDNQLDSTVAIKMLVPPPATAELARERLRREAKTVRQLAHSNIVALYDYLEDGPWSFLVMEYIDGSDMAERVEHRGPLSVEEAVEIGRGIAGALHAAHEHGILHRDVKPHNILLDREGCPRLADFGSARLDGQATLTVTGGVVGTLAYTAPEVLAGARGDARSDVYSLGMSLFYALTGRLPSAPGAQLPPTPCPEGHGPGSSAVDVPDWLDDVIRRATAASPNHRFTTAALLQETLSNGDTGLICGVAPTDDESSCLICGGPDPLGLLVCPSCGGVSGGREKLLLVPPARRERDRNLVAKRLTGLGGARIDLIDAQRVALGYRALVRVPAATADHVVELLGRLDIPAKAIDSNKWTPLPGSFNALLLLVLAFAPLAAAMGIPGIPWTSLLTAALLGVSAQWQVRQCAVQPVKQQDSLPNGLKDRLTTTLRELPPGAGRDLLADIVRTARGLPAPIDREVSELLEVCCDAARDITDLDETLSSLARPGRKAAAGEEWWTTVSHCERTRDRLTQQMLGALTLLARSRTSTAESTDTGQLMSEWAAQLRDHVTASEEANREVEALLT